MGSIAKEANKAVIYSEPGTTKTHIAEFPVEAPGPGEVLVRLKVWK
jgi:alcohol dehydrogenase, propanol-preferring